MPRGVLPLSGDRPGIATATSSGIVRCTAGEFLNLDERVVGGLGQHDDLLHRHAQLERALLPRLGRRAPLVAVGLGVEQLLAGDEAAREDQHDDEADEAAGADLPDRQAVEQTAHVVAQAAGGSAGALSFASMAPSRVWMSSRSACCDFCDCRMAPIRVRTAALLLSGRVIGSFSRASTTSLTLGMSSSSPLAIWLARASTTS